MAAEQRPRVLVVEDEVVTRTALVDHLTRDGFIAEGADSAAAMFAAIDRARPDLVLLDLLLTDGNAIGAIARLRARVPDLGIVIATGVQDRMTPVMSLEMGADDFIRKPLDLPEVAARLRAVHRRAAPAAEAAPSGGSRPGDHILHFAGWRMDVANRRLLAPDDRLVNLTRIEFELLAVFAARVGQVVSRGELSEAAFHRPWRPEDRTVDVVVGRLRRKLEADPRNPTLLLTVHGRGYQLSPG